MRRAFTLIELLVVIGIMGLLGTASVGGYRAMQRGMEERGVLDNVDKLIKAAYERAQIDRQPTAVYFWNELLREETDDQPAIVVGRAVAVRRQGRCSRFSGGILFDEFADLDKTYPRAASAADGGDGSGDSGDNTMYLYCLENIDGGDLRRSVVSQRVVPERQRETYMNDLPQDVDGGEITLWGFHVENDGGIQWKAGMSYGIEFAELTLPHNYIFGNNVPTSIENPEAGGGAIVCKVGRNTNDGVEGSPVVGNVTVYSRRPGDGGAVQSFQVGTSHDPSQE